MNHPIGKVTLDVLEAFLRRHAKEWDVEGLPSFEEHLPPHRPVNVDDLILGIKLANQAEDHAYLFGSEMTPHEAVQDSDLDAVPSLEESQIDDFVIRMGKARDFLYVAPSIEDVSNGLYVNLMPVDLQEEDEEELDDAYSPTSPPHLTEMRIENFKGVGSKQSIELKPITLLFGPNSGGKSTIIQAVHYALEIMDRRNLDADRTALGGSLVDLGGFDRFVHKHELRRLVRIGFGLDLQNASWPDYPVLVPDYGRSSLLEENRELPAEWASLSEGLPNFAHDVDSAYVEVAVGWSEIDACCFVEEYRVAANGLPLATLSRTSGGRDILISELNTKHPLFRPGFAAGEYCRSEDDSILDYWLRVSHGLDEWGEKPLFVAGLKDALPEWGKSLALQLDVMNDWPIKAKDDAYWADWAGIRVVSALSQLLVGIGEILRNLLRQFCYLGPLREIPPRSHRPPRFHDPARWSNGLAAWDILYDAPEEFVEKVGDWLADRGRLDTGYRVWAHEFREVGLTDILVGMVLSDMHFDIEEIRDQWEKLPIRRRLLLRDERAGVEAEAQDVGSGITQIVPVIVAALRERRGLVAIEQPELHVHPRVQVGLGDLLVYAIHQHASAPFLIETHSEHLLLRLLRRIRETTDGEVEPASLLDLRPDQLAVYYVESSDAGSVVVPLRIDETGEFIDRWPRGFFEERARELF